MCVCVCVCLSLMLKYLPRRITYRSKFLFPFSAKETIFDGCNFLPTLSVNYLQFRCIKLGIIIIFAPFHQNALERLKIRYLATLIATSSARRGALISISYLERNVTSISINPASNKGLRATRKGARSSSPSIHLTLSWIVNPWLRSSSHINVPVIIDVFRENCQ